MSTHNICFYGEIRKIFIRIPLLSGALFSRNVSLEIFCQVFLTTQSVARHFT